MAAREIIADCLTTLEDVSLYTDKSKAKSFERLKLILDQTDDVTPEEVQRSLAVLLHCIKEDIAHLSYALAAVTSLLNVKCLPKLTVQDYIPSALGLLQFIKTVGVQSGAVSLRKMSIDLFLSYPVDVIAEIVRCTCSEVLEIFHIYKPTGLKCDKMSREMCHFLQRLLSILHPEQKRQFANEGTAIWFGDLVPTLMKVIAQKDFNLNLIYLRCLEMLTEHLLMVDYETCPQWMNCLKCICQSREYPALIINLLKMGDNNVWQRIWIVFIKLLKDQITCSIGSFGTPINSMLPVVEMAFKMDVQNRCYAFECWEVLINTFSKDTSDNSLIKRMKLLLIPLKSNNAKTEETALAKFNCWWHLITTFELKLDKFTSEVLLSFIAFAFGKNACNGKQAVSGAAQLFAPTKDKCIEAFVNIVGHEKCHCNTTLPRLKSTIMTSKLLVSCWSDWMFALKAAVLLTVENETYNVINKENPMPVLCAWKYIVTMLAELPNNGIRRDLFNGLIKIMTDVNEMPNSNKENLSKILMCLILTLFEDEKVMDLLTSNVLVEDLPMSKILIIITSPQMNQLFKRYATENVVEMLKPMTTLLVQNQNTVQLLDWLLDTKMLKDSQLWTVVVESMLDLDDILEIDPETLKRMIMWPLKAVQPIQKNKRAGILWYSLYNATEQIFDKTNDTIERTMLNNMAPSKANENTKYFKLCVTIALLKNKLANEEDIGVLAITCQNLTSEGYVYIELLDPVLPALIDTIFLMLTSAIKTPHNIELARVSLNCTINTLKVISAGVTTEENVHSDIIRFLENLFHAVHKLFQIPSYVVISTQFLDELKTYLLTLSKERNLFKHLLKTLQIFLVGNSLEEVKNKINSTINFFQEKENDKVQVDDNLKSGQEFTIPEKNNVVKKKKKEANIVNTVIENGEEYVVVKSNWKFNPRKLTENQKEKLQRKREDIPALYQDLSQSQEEFKLSTWKTDSQDTTSTNSKSSKSATENEVSNTLKNMGSSDVIPSIMENILSENYKNQAGDQIIKFKDKVHDLQIEKSKLLSKSTPKSTKSPRMALKDRVFRNVKKLENSTKDKGDAKENPEDEGLINNVTISDISKTPTTKEESNKNLLNSGPPLLSADRPSRMRKIPKKFDDVQLFDVKKRRNSVRDSLVDSSNNKDTTFSNENKIDDAVTNNNTEENMVNTINMDQDIPEQSNLVETLPETDITNSHVNETVIPYRTEVEVLIKSEFDINECKESSVKNTGKDQIADVAPNIVKDVISLASTNDFDVVEKINDEDKDESESLVKAVQTPPKKSAEPTQPNSTVKKRGRKSRIENELAIDMVAGHPFLKMATKNESPKRITRKKLLDSDTGKRKSNTEKLNTSRTPRSHKKLKKKENEKLACNITSTLETQDKNTSLGNDSVYDGLPCSEDVIESSQDSTFTSISVKSTKRTPKGQKKLTIKLSRITKAIAQTQDLKDSDCEILSETNKSVESESKDDIELPQNKTAVDEKNQSDLTENMDTEPISSGNIAEDVILVNDDETHTTINFEKTVGPETQELAEADTQPNNFEFEGFLSNNNSPKKLGTKSAAVLCSHINGLVSQEDITQMDTEPINVSLVASNKETEDEVQRKQDFLNNTSEISPIKVQSPDRDKVPQPQETSTDYVLVKLSAPVKSNGEPFDKSASPEFFTEDKISPEKREQSPPRPEVSVNSVTSPSSVLSLKKNRPQVRPGGRAAHMLGLCVPNSLNAMNSLERSEPEDAKKSSSSTPARRNLRLHYNAVSDADEAIEEDIDNFLNFKKALPSSDSSPSVPILKRKLVDIADDATASPANKRKRVSFHDPPVSTTVSVEKYIDRSSMLLRTYTKSPKRLEFVKLNTALSKAVDSFTEEQLISLTNDTLDVTPAVEIVKTSELNDTDPICLELAECKDSIENIATELSSPAMKDLFIKELEGKVGTVGDLAKMTELEVNRLCIKAPKVQVAKKVLNDYVSRKKVPEVTEISINETALSKEMDEEMTESETKTCCVEIQTDKVAVCDSQMQTNNEIVKVALTQTDIVSVATTSMQTTESGFKPTSDVITSCLSERQDFVERLSEQLDMDSVTKLAGKLPTDTVIDLLANSDSSKSIFNKILDIHSQNVPSNEKHCKELEFINDYLRDKYDDRSLILFCSQILQKMHDKSKVDYSQR